MLLSSPKLLSDIYASVRRTHGLDVISDCSIAICATYYLHLFLDNPPYHEPLLSALGGLTGIEAHIAKDLDKFKEHDVIPFFIFDGQSMVGQAETTVKKSRGANRNTDEAWKQYFASRAEEAVASFGANGGLPKPTLCLRCAANADEAFSRCIPHPELVPLADEAPTRAGLPFPCGAVQCCRSGSIPPVGQGPKKGGRADVTRLTWARRSHTSRKQTPNR